MFQKTIFVMVAAFMLAGILWMIGGRNALLKTTPSTIVEDKDNGNEKIALLESELAQMKKEMDRVSFQSGMAARMGNIRADIADAEPEHREGENGETTSKDPDVTMEEGRQRVIEKFDRLSSNIEKERRDEEWAVDAEAELGTVVKELEKAGPIGAKVLSTECKSTMCKVEVAYDSMQSQSYVSDAIRSMFFSGGEVRRYEENGELRSTAFYYRQGYQAPE